MYNNNMHLVHKSIIFNVFLLPFSKTGVEDYRKACSVMEMSTKLFADESFDKKRLIDIEFLELNRLHRVGLLYNGIP